MNYSGMSNSFTRHTAVVHIKYYYFFNAITKVIYIKKKGKKLIPHLSIIIPPQI